MIADTRTSLSIRGAPELGIIVPTFNERDNIPALIERIRIILDGVDWELIFVDDNSSDGTADVAKTIGELDGRVRCIRRIGRRGLAGACLEGILASQALYVAVIDGDLQHDETLLFSMLNVLRKEKADVIVGSRYIEGGAARGLPPHRLKLSQLATAITGSVLRVKLNDPMSGFFMARRKAIEEFAPRLSTQGFKILLDIVMTAQGRLRIVELPYRFRERLYGSSKLDALVALDFLGLILAKATNDLISIRFVFFALVGIVGIGVHFSVLVLCFKWFELSFATAQTIAIVVAIAVNFVLNNQVTYRDEMLTGRKFIIGLAWFYVVSLFGAVSNVGVGNWLFLSNQTWWIAGVAGGIIGVVWNYVISSLIVWRTR